MSETNREHRVDPRNEGGRHTPAKPIRNRIGFRDRVAHLQGHPVDLDLRGYDAEAAEIARLEREVAPLGDAQIEQRARGLRAAVRAAAAPLAEVRPMVFALAREAARRALGLRPFDVQIVAALALDRGRIVEMQTGEGKTLAAVMPACLNAFADRGVHVLTFNDYLARRDAGWMGPVYRMLGLSVDFVQQGMATADRGRAYGADVTYVTAKEAGFDHLRDLLATDPAALVHRPFHFAIVDEADSLLVDEARSPLVIAGSVADETVAVEDLAALVASFVPGVHFDADEHSRDVELTDAGIEAAERALLAGTSLHDERNYPLLTRLNCALHAQVLLRRDVDYLVRDGRIQVIDEFTGRVVHDRHWPDGLQAALEAKEGLARRADGRILGSMTLQHFLGSYPRLCGMTGTARDAASEMHELYGLRTVIIPTNRPMIRTDRPDLVFTHGEAKEKHLVEEVRREHARGRPVLVGTLTVEESERVARALGSAGVPCATLNARNDAEEAAIIARAGTFGAVTISTNMAGRGTDIRLGGEDESDRDRVAALGGLYVIGTNRHESRRVDLQLRGRAGRQGDPGESRFLVSLEDELVVRYGIRDLVPAAVFPSPRDEPIAHPVIRREIARAQRIIEGENLEIRRTLWRYASLVEIQRRRVMERRQAVLRDAGALRVWKQAPARRAALVAAAGEEAAERAERAATLHHIDRAWRDHLSLVADLREGIHLVALGGSDPLTRFAVEIVRAFEETERSIDEAVLAEVERAEPGSDGITMPGIDIKGPSSTWTYIVNDDPFRNQIGMLLTGPGRTSVAIYAAVVLGPLLVLWGVVDRLFRRRPGRRQPFGGGAPRARDRVS